MRRESVVLGGPEPIKKAVNHDAKHTHLSFHHRRENTQASIIIAAMDAEKSRGSKPLHICHVMWNYYLYPNGTFHMWWDLMMLWCVLFSVIWEPYTVSFFYGMPNNKMWFEILFDVLFWFDIVVNFWTAYDTGYELETKKSDIAMHYLQTWFFVDLVSTLDFDYYLTSTGSMVEPGTKDVLRMLRLIKAARIFRVSRLINRITITMTIHSSFIEAYKFFLYVFVVAHYLACMFFLVPALVLESDHPGGWREQTGINQFANPFHQYWACLYWAFTTMTTIGYGDYKPFLTSETILVIIAEIIGLAVFAILLTRIQEVSMTSDREQKKQAAHKDSIIGFLSNAGIKQPEVDILIDKIREFLRFRAKSNYHTFEDDDPRFNCISYALRDEIKQHIFFPALMRIKMFNDQEAKEQLRNLLEQLDTDEVKGFIDEDEFDELSKQSNLNMSMDEIKQAMNEMGVNEDGMVTVDSISEWYHYQKYGVPRLEFPHAFVALFAARLRAVAFSPADVIVRKGEYGNKLVMVLSGAVHVHKRFYKDVRLGVLFRAKKAAQKLKKHALLRTMSKNNAASLMNNAAKMSKQEKKDKMLDDHFSAIKVTPRDRANAEDGTSTVTKVAGGTAGETDFIVAVKASHRYPCFGLIAALHPAEFTTMLDRTRRWEVRVKSHQTKGNTSCADVAFIDRYQLQQIMNSTWDGGQEAVLNFVRCHYDCPQLGDAAFKQDELNLSTADYEVRANINRLGRHHKQFLEMDKPVDPKGSLNIDAVKGDIDAFARSLLLATQLTDARMKQLEASIVNVGHTLDWLKPKQ